MIIGTKVISSPQNCYVTSFDVLRQIGMTESKLPPEGDQKMKKLLTIMRLAGRIATAMLLSPTDGALWTGTALTWHTR